MDLDLDQSTFNHVYYVLVYIRGVDSYLNPGEGAGSKVMGIISSPGLNRVNSDLPNSWGARPPQS